MSARLWAAPIRAPRVGEGVKILIEQAGSMGALKSDPTLLRTFVEESAVESQGQTWVGWR